MDTKQKPVPQNYYSPDTFNRMLETMKKEKDKRNGFKAPDYRQYSPQELDTDWEPSPIYQQLQEGVLAGSRAATATTEQIAQNEKDYKAMIQAQRQASAARRNRVQRLSPVAGSGGGAPTGGTSTGGAPIPAGTGGGPYPKLDPYASLKTINWRGHSLTLNSTAVPRFVGFLNALWKTGYRPHVIGSYANRNIAGTSTRSLHSYGFAIDIDPASNPVTYNGARITSLPSNVGALASRFGLAWGGNWNGPKLDFMHFSVPWFGTK